MIATIGGIDGDDIFDHPLFVRFGWCVAVVLVLAATIPGAYLRAFGGGIALLLAIGAALLHWLETKKRRPPRRRPKARLVPATARSG